MKATKNFPMVFALLVISLAGGCSEGAKQPRHAILEWSEPVQLASGETVRIKRHVEMWHERAFGGGYSSAPVYKTNSIELEPISVDFPKLDTPLVPVVMDRDPANGEWIVVASIDGCSLWLRNGLPRPPYWAFRLRGREWFRDALPESFLNRSANLFVEYDTVDTSIGLDEKIVDRKRQQLADPKHARQYAKIDATYGEFEGCGRDRPTRPVGQDELDLANFRRAP